MDWIFFLDGLELGKIDWNRLRKMDWKSSKKMDWNRFRIVHERWIGIDLELDGMNRNLLGW